ncbi:MAG TPA: nitrite reductase small subunit NirD [Candidatus Corynebacterium avicola]|uniref:Nitrite reductase small subunit NirD n=1 Tax=Candidatus Corynebacterium avicola TaxID=2838527 RepID=A0A9D1RQF1_9CORY|nr:nitrite reductase small subunit NirD [Candidatus Corynebacterium avicola]
MTVATTHPVTICMLDDLEDNLGAAVLLPDGTQVALFRVTDTDGAGTESDVYAVSNIDPYMGAAVMSRGIVGDHDGVPTVASPLLKQRFRLTDGVSLEDDAHVLRTFATEVIEDHGEQRVLLHH